MLTAIMLAATVMAAPEKAETDVIFAAASGTRRGPDWTWCREDPRAKLRIDLYRDLNGDGLVDVVVAEDSAQCYGNTGTAFALVAQGPKGKWRKLVNGTGIAEVLDKRPGGLWPDIRIAGPGFCFPVLRWTGKAYVQHRLDYLGKPCRK